MGIDATVYARLNDNSITTFTGTRIFLNDATENTVWPFIVYSTRSTAPVVVMNGTTGLAMYSLQVDVWAKTPADGNDISIAVIGRLHCFQGTGVVGCFVADQDSEPLSSEEGDISHTVLTFTVWAAWP